MGICGSGFGSKILVEEGVLLVVASFGVLVVRASPVRGVYEFYIGQD